MKKNKLVTLCFYLLLIVFIASYIISNSGYYEYKLQEKTILTNEKIKKFEQDIKENKNIDLEDYLVKDKSYSNKFTNLIYKISDDGNKLSRKFIKEIFKRLSKMIDE